MAKRRIVKPKKSKPVKHDHSDKFSAHTSWIVFKHGPETQSKYARELAEKIRYAFDESKHPRGQPENAGEFTKVQEAVAVSRAKHKAIGEVANKAAQEHTQKQKPKTAVGFVSPNEGPPTDFEAAKQIAISPLQEYYLKSLEKISAYAGLKATARAAIGDWAPGGEDPGAEPSAEIDFQDVTDFDQVKYAMCMAGMKHKQIAVLPFMEDDDGPDTLWEIESEAPAEDIRKQLDSAGLPYRTLVDMGHGRTRIVVFDSGSTSETATATKKVADHYGIGRTVIKGHGEFFPPGNNSREESIALYRKYISEYEQYYPERTSGRNQGRDPAGQSKGLYVRDAGHNSLVERFSRVYQERYKKSFVESEHPRGKPANAGEFTESRTAVAISSAKHAAIGKVANQAAANHKIAPDDPDTWGGELGPLRNHAIKWMESLTPAEKNSIESYCENAHQGINQALRHCGDTPECFKKQQGEKIPYDFHKMYKDITAAIKKFGKLPEPVTVYRGIASLGAGELLPKLAEAIKNKAPIQLLGITSTSMDETAITKFLGSYLKSRAIVLRIKAKSGAYVEGLSRFSKEREFIQTSGIKYRVLSINQNEKLGGKKRTVVDLEEI